MSMRHFSAGRTRQLANAGTTRLANCRTRRLTAYRAEHKQRCQEVRDAHTEV